MHFIAVHEEKRTLLPSDSNNAKSATQRKINQVSKLNDKVFLSPNLVFQGKERFFAKQISFKSFSKA